MAETSSSTTFPIRSSTDSDNNSSNSHLNPSHSNHNNSSNHNLHNSHSPSHSSPSSSSSSRLSNHQYNQLRQHHRPFILGSCFHLTSLPFCPFRDCLYSECPKRRRLQQQQQTQTIGRSDQPNNRTINFLFPPNGGILTIVQSDPPNLRSCLKKTRGQVNKRLVEPDLDPDTRTAALVRFRFPAETFEQLIQRGVSRSLQRSLEFQAQRAEDQRGQWVEPFPEIDPAKPEWNPLQPTFRPFRQL